MKATLFTTCNAEGARTGELLIFPTHLLCLEEISVGRRLYCRVSLVGQSEKIIIKTDATYAMKRLGIEMIDARSP